MNIAIPAKRTLSKINLPFLCLVFIVLLNAFLKTHQYLERGFLWFDEIKLAMNLQNRTYLQLFQSLDHGQTAPPLFLASTKFLVSIFGDSERVFRLLPYLASIFNPVLLSVVLKKRLKTDERLLCVLFFCLAPLCIRYASEFKPYGTDIFFGLLAYWALAHFDKNLSLKALLSYSVLFILLPLFSIPVVFILGTFLLVTFFETLSNRKQMFPVIFLGGCVILTYVIVYYSFAAHHPHTELFWSSKIGTINDSWESFAAKTYLNYLVISRQNLGFESFSILGSVIFFLGVFRYLKRDFKNALLFFLPILFCFIASCLLIYPFNHRMVLLLYPSFFLGLSLGIGYFTHHKILIFKVLGLSLLLTLIFHPFKTAIHNYRHPYQDAQTEKLLMIIDRKIDTPDPIYLYFRSSYAWMYHWPRISNKKVSPVIVRANTFAQQFEAAPKTDRFWLIFFRCHRRDRVRDRNKILEEVKKTAFCSQEYNQDNDSAYLCYYLKKFKRVV